MKILTKIAITVLVVSALVGLCLLLNYLGLNLAGVFDPKYAVIWSGVIGAIIGSGISFQGVKAANKSSLDRLAQQHDYDRIESIKQRKHDAEQKNEDRKAAIRREVYTEAVAEVHAVLASIGGMPERPWSDRAKDADGLQLFLKANSKVWLVAESEAAFLSRELASLMSELYFYALHHAQPLRLAMEPVRVIERQIVHAESEILRIYGRIAELKEQRADAESIEAAFQSWTTMTDWVKSLNVERDRQIRVLGPNRFMHAETLFNEMKPVQRIIVRVVSALRKEIHLPADEAQFLLQLADVETRAMAALRRAYGIGANKNV